MQRAVKETVRNAGLVKHTTCHMLRHMHVPPMSWIGEGEACAV